MNSDQKQNRYSATLKKNVVGLTGILMAWNGIVENRESFQPVWKKQITAGNALEKWRAPAFPFS